MNIFTHTQRLSVVHLASMLVHSDMSGGLCASHFLQSRTELGLSPGKAMCVTHISSATATLVLCVLLTEGVSCLFFSLFLGLKIQNQKVFILCDMG